MSAIAKLPEQSAIESIVINGDLKTLTPEQRVAYYGKVCDALGLNNMTQPFSYLTLNGKLVLYANKSCTEQLRKLYGVSITIVSREHLRDDGLYVVTARSSIGDRTDESIGAVNLKGKSGDDLANALMKAETKAKRRATLSICGLAMLDESEVDSIPGATHEQPIQRIEQTKAAPPATPAPERQPGDPDPDEIIDDPTCKHLGSLFKGSGWKWADLLAKIGVAPGTLPAFLRYRECEAAVRILTAKDG